MSFFTRTLSYCGPSSHLRRAPLRREISTHSVIRGVYFKPTPQDLIEFLNKKIRGDYCPGGNALPTFNLGDRKPEWLVEEYHNSLEMSHSDLAKLQMKNVIYFFTDRSGERKKSGWCQTGKASDITNEDGHKIGNKRYLNYRESRSDGKKMTTWIIHEYSSNLDHPDKDRFRICKLMKSDEGKRKEEAETRGDASTSSNTPQVFSSTRPSLTTDTSRNQQVSYGAIANFGCDEHFAEDSAFQMFSSTNPPPNLHEPGQNSSTDPCMVTPYMSGNQQVSYGATANSGSTYDEMFSSTHEPPYLYQSGQVCYGAMPLYQPSYETWFGVGLSGLGATAGTETTIPESDGVDGGGELFGFLNLLNVTLTDLENLF